MTEDKEVGATIHEEYHVTHANVATSHFIQPKSAAEKRLLLKADLLILPLAAFGYFAAYMDRNNLGNAKVMGFSTDLGLSSNQYYSCLTMFYVGYMIFMLPVNLSLRKLKANRSIGSAVVLFGVIMCCLSVAKSFSVVMALRFLLGVGQSFIQGLTIYTSLWYRREELATRSALYYSCATISGAFGGLIAYGIEANLPYKTTGRYSWSWLFLIEGVIAIGAGLLILFLLPHMPDELQRRKRSHWLFTQKEIDLAAERQASYNHNDAKFQPRQLLYAMTDIKTWFFSLIQGANVLGLAVVGNFLPTFINGFGFNPVQTQLFTVIPYACAFVVCIVLGIMSDRVNRKAPFLLITSSLAVLGYTLLLATTSIVVGIVASCLITASCYTGVVILPVWIMINTAGHTKRSCVWATSEVFAMSFSIMATRIYNTPPRFVKGHSIVLSLNVVAWCCIVFAALWMRHQNRKKDRIEQDYVQRGEVHPHLAERLTLEDVQDAHISFRYIL